MIEVEQKFRQTAHTRSRLVSLGSRMVGRRQLHDVYYDTAGQDMMRADHWLRKRGGRWELKCRHRFDVRERISIGGESVRTQHEEESSVLQDTQSGTDLVLQDIDQYTEENDELFILKHLEEVFQVKTKCGDVSTLTTVTMDTLVECGALVPIVEVKCVRECYVVRETGDGVRGGGWEEVKIDLDECVCGEGEEERRYGVGEVEITVLSQALVQSAAQRCRDLAIQLGKSLCPVSKYQDNTQWCTF